MTKEDDSPTQPDFESFDLGLDRNIESARTGISDLGLFELLPGTWSNIRVGDRRTEPDGKTNPFFSEAPTVGLSPMNGRGWNIIALPINGRGHFPPYRVMMNQYNEVLHFDRVDEKLPSRAVNSREDVNTNQKFTTLGYLQEIRQLKAADNAGSISTADDELPIHQESGFFLNLKKHGKSEFTVARLATTPLGNTVNSIGSYTEIDGPPTIPDLSGLPLGASSFDIEETIKPDFLIEDEKKYLQPYRYFIENPFMGILGPPFRGFEPRNVNKQLRLGLASEIPKIKKTVQIVFDDNAAETDIAKVPFMENQPDATLMSSTFWIMELDEISLFGEPRLLLAYSQFVFLEFFQRRDGTEGLTRWPHVSINIMEKTSSPPKASGL